MQCSAQWLGTQDVGWGTISLAVRVGGRTAVKCCPLDTTWLLTRPAQDQARQNYSISEVEDLEAPLLTGDLLTVGTYWGRESNSFEDVANGVFLVLQCTVPHPCICERHQLFLVSYK